MFSHREMEKIDFSFDQVCSKDHFPSQYLVSPFTEEMENIGCPNGYNRHIVIGYFHVVTINYINLLT